MEPKSDHAFEDSPGGTPGGPPGDQEDQVEQAVEAYLEGLQAGVRPDRYRLLRSRLEVVRDADARLTAIEELYRLAQSHRSSFVAPCASAIPEGPGGEDEVGRFHVLGKLGEGASAGVWWAYDQQHDRDVALKILRPEEAGNAATVERFVRCGRIQAELGQLGQPHVVRVYETGEHQGRRYLAMELVGGGTLEEALSGRQGRPWDFRAAALLVQKVAEAVDCAHQRDVVHRDLTPSNILLDELGEPKVTDFGLARVVECGQPDAGVGRVVGTPAYMAPEQARGKAGETDGRADVYSLGVIFYRMLTGRLPFEKASVPALLKQVIEKVPPPPRRINPDVPAELETICLKAMEKHPGDRFVSAKAMADELGRWLRRQPLRVRRPGWRDRAWRWAIGHPAAVILAVAAPVLGVVIVSLAMVSRAEHDVAQAEHARAVLEAETRQEVEVRAILEQARSRVSRPDINRRSDVRALLESLGKPWHNMPEGPTKLQLALEARSVFAASLAAHDVRVTQEAKLPDAFPWIWPVALDPDGKAMAVGTARGPVRWVEGEPFRAPEGLQAHQPQPKLWYSPDGHYLAFAPTNGGLQLWDRGVTRVVAELDPPRSNVPTLAVWFQPDGKGVRACRADGQLRFFSLPGFQPGTPTHVPGPAGAAGFTAAAFSEDGDRLAVGDSGGRIRLCEPDGGKVLGELRAGTRVHALAWSPGHKLVAAGTQDGSVQLWQEDGVPLRRLTGFSSSVSNVLFDPDGQRVLAGGRTAELKMWDVASGELLLTTDRAPWGLSHDGRHLAASTATGPAWCELVMPRAVRQLSAHRARIERISWCSDDRHFASLDTAFHVQVWDAVRGAPLAMVTQPPGPEYTSNVGLALSPDAGRVATAGMQQAFVWDARSGKQLCRWQLPPAFGNLLAGTGKDRFLLIREELDKWQTVVYELLPAQNEIRKVKVLRASVPGEGGMHDVSFTPDGRYYCWVGPRRPARDCRVEVYEVATGRLVTRVPVPCKEEHTGADAHVSADGRYLGVYSAATGESWYDLTTQAGPHAIRAATVLAPRGSGWVAFGGSDARRWPLNWLALRPNVADPDWLEFGITDGGFPSGISFSSDGRWLAWGSGFSGAITLVHLDTLRQEVGDFEQAVLSR